MTKTAAKCSIADATLTKFVAKSRTTDADVNLATQLLQPNININKSGAKMCWTAANSSYNDAEISKSDVANSSNRSWSLNYLTEG